MKWVRMMGYYLFVVALTLSAMFSYCFLEKTLANYILINTYENTFQILDVEGQLMGSGFQINYGKGYVVTNYHVCRGDGSSHLTISNDLVTKKVQILYKDVSTDVCLLGDSGQPGLRVSWFNLTKHQKVVQVGSPAAENISAREGHVIGPKTYGMHYFDIENEYDVLTCIHGYGHVLSVWYQGLEITSCFKEFEGIHATILTTGGGSGSSITTEFGMVVGMTQASATRTNSTYFIPVKKITNVIDQYEKR